MVRLFRTNIVLQVIIIAAVSLLLWGRTLVGGGGVVAADGFAPLYRPIYSLLNQVPMVASIIAFVLIVAEGFLLNALLYERKLIPTNTLLPCLLYVTAMCLTPNAMTLSPMVIINLLTILILRLLLLSSTLLTIPIEKIFGSAALIALASLFYLPAIVLLIPLLIIFIIYKLYSWRDWVVLLLGIAAPYILLFCHYFLSDKMTTMWGLLLSNLSDWNLTLLNASILEYVSCALFLAILLVSLTYLPSFASSTVVIFRKNSGVICSLFIGSILLTTYSGLYPVNTQPFSIPFAFSAATFFLTNKMKSWVGDILLSLLIIVDLIINYC